MKKTNAAYSNSLRVLNNTIAPLAIITIVKEFKEALSFLLDKPFVSLSSIILFSGFFIYNFRKESKLNAEETNYDQSTSFNENKSKRGSRASIVTKTIAGSGLLLILVLTYIGIFHGVYYPLLASSKSIEYVEKRVDEINQYLESEGVKDLKATYVESWSNEYYGIIINGYTLSKKTAQGDFERIKKIMPSALHNDIEHPENNAKVAHMYWLSAHKYFETKEE